MYNNAGSKFTVPYETAGLGSFMAGGKPYMGGLAGERAAFRRSIYSSGEQVV